MLPRVSRTFALNIARLKGPLYLAVLIGYLLFRMADTLEDHPALSEEEKVRALEGFSQLFHQSDPAKIFAAHIDVFKRKMSCKMSEEDLIIHGDRVFSCLSSLPESYRGIIGRALAESAQGMAEYQLRKKNFPQKIFQLEDENDLTRYCYYVAGVVGKMLTELFCREEGLGKLHSILVRHQIHFGIALQMTNIIKDYPRDMERGWCYLPKTLTNRLHLSLEQLTSNPVSSRAAVNAAMVPRIIPHLDGAYRYIAELPISSKDIRMFCIIPFVLAYHTLAHLRLTLEDKLPRKQVHHLLKESETFCQSNAALKADYEAVLRNLIARDLW
jgi:farnesyl-diphosphate farnesyltransferase